MTMDYGGILLRWSAGSNQWVEARVAQVMFSPTYLGVLEGLPTKEQLEGSLRRRANDFWGERSNLRILTGPGKPRYDNLTPEATHELEKKGVAHIKYPPSAMFVELKGPLLDPADPYDFKGRAWLVLLGPSLDLAENLDHTIQQLIYSYELVWDEIALNTAP